MRDYRTIILLGLDAPEVKDYIPLMDKPIAPLLRDLIEKQRAEKERRQSALRDWLRIALAVSGLLASLLALWIKLD
jgi:hypothetical protein